MSDPNWKALLVEPMLRYVNAVRLETGVRPTIEVYVHSELYDRLVAETATYGQSPGTDDRGPLPSREGMSFGGIDDLTIRPERARPGYGQPPPDAAFNARADLITRIALLRAAQRPGEPLSDAQGPTVAGHIASAVTKLERALEMMRLERKP